MFLNDPDFNEREEDSMTSVNPERGINRREEGSARLLATQFRKALDGYALSASAAGVAVLACSLPADCQPICKTIHTDLVATDTYSLNPAHQKFAPFNVAETWKDVSSLSSTFWNRGFFTPNTSRARVMTDVKGYPATVPAGGSIGPGKQFGRGKMYGLLFTYGPANGGKKHDHKGNLQLLQDNYLGFKFPVGGQDHYGWLRLKVTFSYGGDGAVGTLHLKNYGYESTPNTPIYAGQCSAADGRSPNVMRTSLGGLARGVLRPSIPRNK